MMFNQGGGRRNPFQQGGRTPFNPGQMNSNITANPMGNPFGQPGGQPGMARPLMGGWRPPGMNPGGQFGGPQMPPQMQQPMPRPQPPMMPGGNMASSPISPDLETFKNMLAQMSGGQNVMGGGVPGMSGRYGGINPGGMYSGRPPFLG
jgi:hypothetical protein